ncbi:DUF616 domain containing protein [Nitzschia inconspicua]|uniref:DUF616 domain containing protein n=1 Tax=Nitzschia inconspicua TaxID=303405 RepID=A0A9K3KVK1_9STRA|nr:DUF616 domain containing protein [Nitzschia inconspicua]
MIKQRSKCIHRPHLLSYDAIGMVCRQRRVSSRSIFKALCVSVVVLSLLQAVYFDRFLKSSSSSFTRDLGRDDLPLNTSISSTSTTGSSVRTATNTSVEIISKKQIHPVKQADKRDMESKAKAFSVGMMLRKPKLAQDTDEVKVAIEMLSPAAIAKVSPDAFQTQCSSPEMNTSWPLQGSSRSILTPSRTCGLDVDIGSDDGSDKEGSNNSFSQYFRTVVIPQQIQPLLRETVVQNGTITPTCPTTVVFGVAFGSEFLNDMMMSRTESGGRVNSTLMLENNGRCFFMFTLQETLQSLASLNNETTSNSTFTTPVLLGHNWVIPIPKHVLPYTNNRRNAKLLKYMGHYAFQQDPSQTPRRIVWQDAKFFRPNTLFDRAMPIDYSKLWSASDEQGVITTNVCVTTMGLPIHFSSFSHLHQHVSVGQTSRFSKGKFLYQEHCKTIISALEARPNVTDNPQGLLLQCQAYMRHVQQQEKQKQHNNNGGGGVSNSTIYTAPNLLDYGLIDSAFIVWDESTEICRNFNRQLRCTMLDQLHCHSDRDQVLLPFVLYKMMNPPPQGSSLETPSSNESPLSWQALYRRDSDPPIPVDNDWDSRYHDFDAVVVHKNHEQTTMLRTIRSSCHWYHTSPIGSNNCLKYNWLPNLEFWSGKLARKHSDKFRGSNATALLASGRVAEEEKFLYLWKSLKEHHSIPTREREGNYSRTCDIYEANAFANHLRSVRQDIQPILDNCTDLVVFGVAMSPKVLPLVNPKTPSYREVRKSHLSVHGKCFFQFVLEEDLKELPRRHDISYGPAVLYGHQWLIPIPRTLLPFQDLQRSTLFLKYHATFIFPEIKSIIWQDTVAFFHPTVLLAQPSSYEQFLGSNLRSKPCVTSFAIPTSVHTTGKAKLEPDQNVFVEYCITQMTNLLLELGHEGEAAALMQQCHDYLQRVYSKELSVEILSHGLIDTNFLIWNESTEHCRRFNKDLQCKIWSELQFQETKWDSVVVPFVLQSLNLSTMYGRNPRIPVNDKYIRRFHDVQFVQEEGGAVAMNASNTKESMVRMIRSYCHWHKRRLGARGCPAFQLARSDGDVQQKSKQKHMLLRQQVEMQLAKRSGKIHNV